MMELQHIGHLGNFKQKMEGYDESAQMYKHA